MHILLIYYRKLVIILLNAMKILFIGAFYQEWYGISNVPCAKVLANQKHHVTLFDCIDIADKNRKIHLQKYYNIYYRLYNWKFHNRFVLPNKLRSLKYFILGNWAMNRLLLRTINQNHYDLIFILKADLMNYNLIPQFNKRSKTWYFFMDPFDNAIALNASKYAASSSWSSSTFMAITKWFNKLGGRAYYIPEGYDAKTYTPDKENSEKDIDVLFVGGKDPKREQFINYLIAHNINVKVHGVGWQNSPLDLKDLIISYRKSKIILNFIRGNDTGFSNRVFISLGTGSFLLSEYCPDIERVFTRNKYLDWFKTPEECLEKIKYYLIHNDEREKIAKEGHEFNLANFTWEKKWEKISEIVEKKTSFDHHNKF